MKMGFICNSVHFCLNYVFGIPTDAHMQQNTRTNYHLSSYKFFLRKAQYWPEHVGGKVTTNTSTR